MDKACKKGVIKMAQYDVVIVGAGPAGMTAAIYAARADMKVLMLDKLAPGGQIINTNEIQNYTGVGSVNGAELAYKMFQHTQDFQVEFDYKTVKEIRSEGNEKVICCVEDDAVYTASSVIIATGTRPRCLNIPGEDKFRGNGISWCAICDGAQYRDKDVVVIGGGNSAVEESIFLAGIVKSLTIVTMFDLTADPMACDKLRAMENVKIYPYQDILEFKGESKLEGVYFKSTKTGEENTVACDGVFEYIGLTPTTEFLKDTGLLNDFGYITVNDKMESNIPGIYGAGDCITKNLRQVITACSDGAIAAQEASHYVERLSR
ncbi:FAD-dependent oxidoreductase [Lachnospiraceae bacterium ASD3451]|uniref:FAD-dependent oxidoreductase n=2 Tax=Diplocloster agilis TaxID=2850323 RepID=A0A949NDW2_9FIRM|nr:FAD-dependent oxidoreductase [Diplocloster agilis]MBU9736426.1 FAD-dependent oxidoreductase [Diplocloster agilis]MBU9744916.1 FAD-dependent oxidoreductase [Diplocloster agilis]MCU6735867.1 FAD-dependent oxidoreductase [Suonthocola fibrivorans]